MIDAHYRFGRAALAALSRGDRRVVVTGAGGWLGMATLELLANALGHEFRDRVVCFGASARSLQLRGGHCIAQRPLADLALLSPCPSVVLHLAFLTKDKVADMSEDDYRVANHEVGATVLAALDRIGANAVFVASSGAARAANDPTANPALRLYGTLKLADEDRFANWAANRGRSAVIARIFNVAGPYINKHEHYAIASFIADALAGRTITVRAPHRVIRGTVAIRELMTLVFCLLLDPEQKIVRFDTGGDPLELAELAAAVAQTLDAPGVDRAAVTSDREDRYVGDRVTYDRLRVRWNVSKVSLAEQIVETADSMVAVA